MPKRNCKGHSSIVNIIIPLFLLIIIMPSFLSAAYTWKNVVFPAGGFVAGVEYSRAASGLIYARTDMGGLYRWDNTNSVWVPLTDFLSDWNLYGGESIAPDPKDPNVVYAAIGQTYNNSNGFILASTNQGNSWTQYNIGVIIGGNADGRNAGERLAVDPNLTSKLYFGSRSGGLWVSNNSAATWAKVASFPVNGDAVYGLSFVIFDPNGTVGTASQTIYVGVEAMSSGNSNIYRSTNGGSTWAIIPGGPANMVPPRASLGADGNLWINYDSGGYGPNGISGGQVWKLNTTTLAWTHVTLTGPTGGGFGGICVDAQNPQHVVVTTLDWWNPDKIYSTINGGTSWTLVSNNGGANQATYNDNGVKYIYWCGNANSGGGGWMGDVEIDPFNSNKAIYTTGQGVYSSANILSTPTSAVIWAFTDYGLEETAVLDMTASVAGGVLFSAVGDIAGMRHPDITLPSPSGMYCNPFWSSTSGIDFAQLNTNIVVRAGNATPYGAYSTNNGVSWTGFSSVPAGTNSQIAVSANGTNILWGPSNAAASYSINNGSSWTSATGLPSGAKIASDRANNNIFYGVSGTTLYVSTNGGASFSTAGTYSGAASRPRAVFGIAGEVWVPTGTGLYLFTNVGLGAVTTTHIANISKATAIGFGKAASGQTHPALYLIGNVGNIALPYGLFRCDDGAGTTWTRINDANHQFGGPSYASGDELVYGRMYIGTNGRGILYGDIAVAGTSTTTPIPTFTRTPTWTSTITNTRTITFTGTASPTFTLTRTNTAVNTLTSTPVSTLTSSAVATATFTAISTNTPVTSPTNTVQGTITNTPVNTFTYTATSMATVSSTYTQTRTSTPVNTRTASPSPLGTNTTVPTSTNTLITTSTDTPLGTPVNTSSATATKTPLNTATNTQVNTSVNTATTTPTRTFTVTSSNTATLTRTAAPTGTSTVTLTFTGTLTRTPADTPSYTATLTPTRAATPDNFEIKDPLVYPNPYNVSQNIYFGFTISQDCSDVYIKIYTISFRLILKETLGLSYAGRVAKPVPQYCFARLANGTYYYVITAKNGSGKTVSSKISELIILR